MKLNDFSAFKKVLIYGYGAEGKSSEKFLKENFPHLEVSIFDENIAEFSTPQDFDDFDVIIRSPGVPREKIAGVSVDKITSQVELFLANLDEERRKKIIGITGTKGKSTTTKFCSELLTRAGYTVGIVGNFGVPPLDIWKDFEDGNYDFLVAELSSFQLEHVSHSPHIAIVLNLFQDHLDRHQTIDAYHAAKLNLVRYQDENDFVITPEETGTFLDLSICRGRIIFSHIFPEEAFPTDSIFRAVHFRQNFGTLVSLCDILKIDHALLQKTAHSFQGLPHRMELFTEKNGIQFVNDAIASNPAAALAAVSFFGEKLGSIILGGKPSGDSWETLLQKIKTDTQSLILLPGGDSYEEVVKTLQKIDFPSDRVIHKENFEEIVEAGFSHTPQGKVCLLSPGAKSFDRFKNYGQKGNTFKKIVLSL